MDTVAYLTLGLLIAAPLLGRIAGALVARGRWLPLGKARSVMPTLPPSQGGSFERRVDEVQRRILRLLLAGEHTGVSAEALAQKLAAPQELTAAALERLRGQARCHLRVTRAGKLLHDFDLSSLKETSETRRPWLSRLVLFLAALLANLGAVWPLFLSLLASSLALLGLLTNTDESWVFAGGVIFAVPLAFGLVIVGGVLVGVLLSPFGASPYLGGALPQDGEKKKKNQAAQGGPWPGQVQESDAFGGSLISKKVRRALLIIGIPTLLVGGVCVLVKASLVAFMIALAITLLITMLVAALGAEGLEGLRLLEAAEAWPVFVVALLLAVALAALAGIGFWVIGLWRSFSKKKTPTMSPGRWVQQRAKPDKLGVLVPTNDLVLRLYRALQTTLSRRRPIDPELASRIHGAAQEQGGRLSALEITLREGLDEEEAIAVGARLSSQVGGEIEVSEEGELLFLFPQSEPRNASSWGECFSLFNKSWLAPKGVPVNITGITLADIQGAERLCAGTILLVLSIWLSHLGLWQRLFGEHAWVAPSWLLLGSAFLVVGVFVLAGVLRYVARAEARAGVGRDLRRATLTAVREALKENDRILSAEHLAKNLKEALKETWPSISEKEILKEVEAACDDLGLELSPERMAATGERRPYNLVPLKGRLRLLQEKRPLTKKSDQEEVIFDTSRAVTAKAT